ncbi:MAG TPA: TMEM175 family protein [Candidatus Acidoferrales bacterium]|nr:TMEM175 family protein [Candidatus Acidoferrales bacterium]
MTAETSRVEAFSDGVFAIAITLLILEMKVPAAGTEALSQQLARQWPAYVSFLISFAFIGVMWINHHRLFTHIGRCDDLLLILNLVLLLGVVVVPFPTAVLATRLGHEDQRAALILYNATYVFIALAFNLLWRHASSQKRHLLAKDSDFGSVQKISAQYAFGPVLYLVCLGLSWVSVAASLALNLALACFFALPPHIATRRR